MCAANRLAFKVTPLKWVLFTYNDVSWEESEENVTCTDLNGVTCKSGLKGKKGISVSK